MTLLHILPLLLCIACSFYLADGKPVDNIQFAFGVMVYQKQGRSVNDVLLDFTRTFKSIYTPEKHLYIIHLDEKSDIGLHDAIGRTCQALSNCLQIAPRNVAWAGLTTGEMMLALMQEAYESTLHFDYFILLGHESIPLVSIPVMERIISSYPFGTNFMNCWKVDNYNFFGQMENNTYRLSGVVVDSFSGQLIENIQQQRTPPKNIVFYKSIQNFVVSREFVRYTLLLTSCHYIHQML
jgi:hypothetical protein